MHDQPDADWPIRIGVSSCLLGEKVRFDGGHKRNSFLIDFFSPFVVWVPVCPEVECGLGTPREAVRLVHKNRRVRMLTIETGTDVTEQMVRYSNRRTAQLERENLCGFVLKKNSPSCGLACVKVYGRHGRPARSGRGIFTTRLVSCFPHLPVEEEDRLSIRRVRDNFIERVFAYRRLSSLFRGRWSLQTLQRFHDAHKLILLAHSPAAHRRLGRLLARAQNMSRAELKRRYTAMFVTVLATIALPRRDVAMVRHMEDP